jgi:hypothetical protein
VDANAFIWHNTEVIDHSRPTLSYTVSLIEHLVAS